MTGRTLRFSAIIAASLLVAAAVRAIPFDHAEHATLFVRCESCHAGAAQSGKALWPTQRCVHRVARRSAVASAVHPQRVAAIKAETE